MNAVRADDLTSLDLRLLETLTESTLKTTTVRLASDMWRGTGDMLGADPVGLVHALVQHLGEYGLVSYKLHPKSPGKANPYSGLAYDVRLTPQGWALMGYPHITYTVGTPYARSIRLDPKGDRTNFRKHGTQAEGVGPIEVDTFSDHKVLFPSHIHMYGDTVTAQETDMSRTYFKATPEVQADVIMAKSANPLANYGEIADKTGVPERTVKYILVDLPRLRRIEAGDLKLEGSLKQRIMTCVETLGRVRDVAELRRLLGMADDEHEVLHVLHSLHTQGRIDFTERGNGMGNATVVNIHLPKKGRNGKHKVAPNAPDFVNDRVPEALLPEEPLRLDNLDGTTAVTVTDTGEEAEPEATAEEVTQPQSESAPEPETEGYPLLAQLMERERNRGEQDQKALAYIEAADAIKVVDPDMARDLLAKAEALNVVMPSPIEREYLDYVAHHQ